MDTLKVGDKVPEFSTVDSPNPEDLDALDLGIKKLKKEKGDILLATDPD